MGSTAARRAFGRVGWSPIDRSGPQLTWLAAGGLLVGAALGWLGTFFPVGVGARAGALSNLFAASHARITVESGAGRLTPR